MFYAEVQKMYPQNSMLSLYDNKCYDQPMIPMFISTNNDTPNYDGIMEAEVPLEINSNTADTKPSAEL